MLDLKLMTGRVFLFGLFVLVLARIWRMFHTVDYIGLQIAYETLFIFGSQSLMNVVTTLVMT